MRMTQLAGVHTKHATLILIAALTFTLAAAVVGVPVVDRLEAGNDFEDPGSQSAGARDAIARATGTSPEVGFVAVVTPAGGARSARGRQRIARVVAVIEREPGVGRVAGAGTRDADAASISRDGRRAYVAAFFREDVGGGDDELAGRLAERLAPFADTVPGGRPFAGFELSAQVRRDLARAELLVLPLLFLLSLWLFRGLIAALLTPLVGIVAILGTLLALRAVNSGLPMSVYALNLVTGLGLGLAIDYSLLVITRYREELQRSGPGPEALAATLRSAGRAVLFSALTVAAALAALVVFPQRFLYSMGVGGAIVALIAAAAALCVLPAFLALLGPRINALALRPRRTAGNGWPAIARRVTRRPGLATLLAVACLGALTLPLASIRFTGVDGHALPSGADARTAAESLERDFAGAGAPAYVAAAGGAALGPSLARYAKRLERVPGVVAVAPPRRAGEGWWRLDFSVRGAPLDEPARATVRAIRAEPLSAPHKVGGQTAAFLDQEHALIARLPVALIIIALVTQLMLLHMTRSVVLAAKAFVTNLLSAAAALGVLVLIFQHGHLTGPLGYSGAGALDATQPVLLCALAFALSTDYGVFLLARIKEAHDRGLPDVEAVQEGVGATGRTITGAALLFCVAVAGIATSQIIFIKELGVGVVAAVAIDATLVRVLLVPGIMCLLKGANWWAPHPLRWMPVIPRRTRLDR
jgi:RND superfamily putative drug exporter